MNKKLLRIAVPTGLGRFSHRIRSINREQHNFLSLEDEIRLLAGWQKMADYWSAAKFLE